MESKIAVKEDQKQDWEVFKQMKNIYTLHLELPQFAPGRMYELKIEQYEKGTKVGEVYLEKKQFNFWGAGTPDRNLSFFTQQLGDSLVEIWIKPNSEMTFKLPVRLKYKDVPYEWVTFITEEHSEMAPLNNWKVLSALVQPPKDSLNPNKCVSCQLPGKVDDYQDWYTELGMKHYYVLMIREIMR